MPIRDLYDETAFSSTEENRSVDDFVSMLDEHRKVLLELPEDAIPERLRQDSSNLLKNFRDTVAKTQEVPSKEEVNDFLEELRGLMLFHVVSKEQLAELLREYIEDVLQNDGVPENSSDIIIKGTYGTTNFKYMRPIQYKNRLEAAFIDGVQEPAKYKAQFVRDELIPNLELIAKGIVEDAEQDQKKIFEEHDLNKLGSIFFTGFHALTIIRSIQALKALSDYILKETQTEAE